MEAENTVVLKHYEPGYYEHLKNFTLPEEQERFTAKPVDMLEASAERFPIVIVSGVEPVGFFVLHSSARVNEYTDNPKAMLLTAFSIDYTQQGKGLAQKGMLGVRDFLKEEFPWCNEIILAVNHKNIPAQNLYKKVGYKDTRRRKLGPIGEQFIYSLSI